MLRYFFQGFLLGAAYVAPIGMQNLYVISTAVRMNRLRAYQAALITSFFDISLAIACFLGIGLLLGEIPALKNIFLIAGSVTVVYIGINLIASKPVLNKDVILEERLIKVAYVCFAVTWLNPQAIIDGSMLLGGFRASLAGMSSAFFIAGVATASFSWFMTITTLVSLFRRFIDVKFLRIINITCGIIMIFFGLRLGMSFIRIIS